MLKKHFQSDWPLSVLYCHPSSVVRHQPFNHYHLWILAKLNRNGPWWSLTKVVQMIPVACISGSKARKGFLFDYFNSDLVMFSNSWTVFAWIPRIPVWNSHCCRIRHSVLAQPTESVFKHGPEDLQAGTGEVWTRPQTIPGHCLHGYYRLGGSGQFG